MSEDTAAADREEAGEQLTALKFVGPATAGSLREAGFDAAAVRQKRVSYRELVDAGVNPGVATKIRREHSLHWSLGDDEDKNLQQRSDQVRGLRDEERAWVAASSGDWADADGPSTGDDGAAEADGSGSSEAAEAAWRERSRPDPVETLDAVPDAAVEKLGSAGITSVRSLATVTPEHVADLLGFDPETVEAWRDAAAERV
jgi:hypothetical protein